MVSAFKMTVHEPQFPKNAEKSIAEYSIAYKHLLVEMNQLTLANLRLYSMAKPQRTIPFGEAS
jgi:hypothetical protein